MASETLADETRALCRSVTPAEIDHYRANGWAKLDRLIDPMVIARLLENAQAVLGENGEANAEPNGAGLTAFRSHPLAGPDAELGPLLSALARNAKALLGREGIEMRYFNHIYLTKLPYGRASEVAGAGDTAFHQDFPDWSLDRAGGMVFWIALTDLQPESGTMSFLSGSHRKGPLGSMRSYLGTDIGLSSLYPDLFRECPPSPPLSYRAGDVTVHMNLCVHGAGENLTDRPRWAHVAIFNPADACWTGAPSKRFVKSAEAGLKPFEPLDDANFPILSAS